MSLERCIIGTAGLGGVWGPVDPGESIGALLLALENGINAIDTAPAYGDAEEYVGEALRNWRGNPPQISTKVGRLKSYDASEGIYDYSDKCIWKSLEQSLSILGVQAVDILFLHEPDRLRQEDCDRIIRTLQEIKEDGLAKKIGLGGNAPEWFLAYLQQGVFDVVMEFNKLNGCNTTALIQSLPYCLANNIQYFAASPLNMGLLGNRFASYINNPPAWLANEDFEAAISACKIADDHQLALHTLAHRFLLSLPYSFKVVIGACNRQQLKEAITDFLQGPLEATVVNKLLTTTKRKTA